MCACVTYGAAKHLRGGHRSWLITRLQTTGACFRGPRAPADASEPWLRQRRPPETKRHQRLRPPTHCSSPFNSPSVFRLIYPPRLFTHLLISSVFFPIRPSIVQQLASISLLCPVFFCFSLFFFHIFPGLSGLGFFVLYFYAMWTSIFSYFHLLHLLIYMEQIFSIQRIFNV